MRSFLLNSPRTLTADDTRVHCHRTWLLVYVSRGVATLCVENQKTRFDAGAFLIIPPEVDYCWEFSGEVEVRSLSVAPKMPAALAAVMPEFEPVANMFAGRGNVLTFKKSISATAGRIMGTMFLESDARRAASLMEVLVRLTAERTPAVAGISRFKVAEDERVRRLNDFIASTDLSVISLDKAADELGMKHPAFCIFFKKAYGVNFVEYINHRKVNMACSLLSRGGLSVAEVMHRVGFHGMPYFIRMFARQTGLTPTRWAKQHRAAHSK